MPIKTLHITNNYHAESGGIRIAYQALLEAANRRRRHVRLVVPGEQYSVTQVGAYGRIYTIHAPHIPFFDSRYRMILPYSFLFRRSGEIWSIIRNEEPDLIEICDKYSLPYLAGLYRKVWTGDLSRPVLVGMSSERMDDSLHAYLSESALGRRFSRWYMGQIYIPQFDFHLANSEYTRNELDSSLLSRHARQTAVCPLGMDCDLFTPKRRNKEYRRRLRSKLSVEEDTVLLLYAGRIAPEKNIFLLPQLMRALARDPSRKYALLIAGSGPARTRLQNAFQELALDNMHLLGQIDNRDELANLFANCDIFLHPNPKEPFGIAPLEAMASGLPLVAPGSGGVLSYANQENSWLTQANAEAFAWKVRNILTNLETRQQKVRRARETAEQFAWPVVTDKMFELYDQIHRGKEVSVARPESKGQGRRMDTESLVALHG